MIDVSECTRCGKRDRDFPRDHAAHGGADEMSGLDAEPIHKADCIFGHVDQLVGCGDGNSEKAQLQEFQWPQRLAADQFARLADVAVVEADDAKAARGELPAEFVTLVGHLGAEPHDQ
jgi:hypothetical protein